jgi:hypothetical protein
VGLVAGRELAVDGTLIAANASPQSWVPRSAGWAEGAQVFRTVQEYLTELEQQNPVAQADLSPHARAAARKVSTTDPDAVWAFKARPAGLAYSDNYLIDTASRVILGVEATPAHFHHETVAARRMLTQVEERFGLHPHSLGADKAYGSGDFLAWLLARSIQPHIPVIDRRHQTHGHFTRDQFRYEPSEDAYYCPQGQPLRYSRPNPRRYSSLYCATPAQCQACPQKARCTSGAFRTLIVHWYEPARQTVRELAGTPAYVRSQRARGKIEALFSELKQRLGLRRVRLRRLWNVAEQFFLAATAQNLKRLVQFLAQRQPQAALSSA